ncbi:BTB/POZ domain-containing protein 6-like [Paramacrobiotus metropolitanus]|uniref:BTB/POZ domain-containing protein 6-like n=1 Tax=Paramacrobiotus metropolitanus TaxID=2943436 RepID=UPI002445A549|nr:BTB/POZ domain-containing protein 6-like [Paramacrobiotus metropolitanus]
MTHTSGAFVSAERRGAICQMGHRWKNALANNELSDVEFAVGRQYGQVKTFRAHRLTLSISSDVFHTMFNGSLAERAGKAIEIPDILPDAFSNLLSYIYTGSVENMKEENALPTLYCADKYDLPWLAELCTDFVVDELDADNCLLYLEHALRWTPDCDPVVEKCWDEVDASSHDVLQSQHFLTLERTTLELILQRSTLSAEENAIYVAVEQWATAACARKNLTPSPANRRRMLGSALYRVRFPLMNDEQLAKGPVQSALLNDSEVRSLYLASMPIKTRWNSPRSRDNP